MLPKVCSLFSYILVRVSSYFQRTLCIFVFVLFILSLLLVIFKNVISSGFSVPLATVASAFLSQGPLAPNPNHLLELPTIVVAITTVPCNIIVIVIILNFPIILKSPGPPKVNDYSGRDGMTCDIQKSDCQFS